MTLQYFIRLECGSEDRMGEPLGPFPEYLQLTYTDLTTLDGRILARIDTDGRWYLADETLGDTSVPWSDVVMWSEENPVYREGYVAYWRNTGNPYDFTTERGKHDVWAEGYMAAHRDDHPAPVPAV